MVSFSTTGLLLHVALFRLGTTHDCAIGQAGPSILSRLPPAILTEVLHAADRARGHSRCQLRARPAPRGRSHRVNPLRAPMSTVRWFLVSLVLVSSGCATSNAPTVDVTGLWGGIWSCPQCPPLQRGGSISMRLDQVGVTVTGDMSWAGGALRPGGRLDGNVSRDVLLFRVPGGDLTGE